MRGDGDDAGADGEHEDNDGEYFNSGHKVIKIQKVPKKSKISKIKIDTKIY